MPPNDLPAIFRRYVCDVVDTLHFIAMEEPDVRVKVRACEVLLRYISAAAEFVDTLSRIERIEEELGISADSDGEEDLDDSEDDVDVEEE